MKNDRNTSRIVGALFIITMVAGGINAYIIDPILFGPIGNVFPNKFQVIIGSFLMLIMSIGIVGIAIVIFPILYRHNKAVAVSYVSFRSIECLLLIIGVISSLILIPLSQEYIQAGSPDTSYFDSISALAIKTRFFAYQIAMIILGFCSMMLCYVFFQSKLIPRSISVLGFTGYVLLFASGFLDILGIIDTVNGVGIILYIPGGLFELIILPSWLIIKGFNTSAMEPDA